MFILLQQQRGVASHWEHEVSETKSKTPQLQPAGLLVNVMWSTPTCCYCGVLGGDQQSGRRVCCQHPRFFSVFFWCLTNDITEFNGGGAYYRGWVQADDRLKKESCSFSIRLDWGLHRGPTAGCSGVESSDILWWNVGGSVLLSLNFEVLLTVE